MDAPNNPSESDNKFRQIFKFYKSRREPLDQSAEQLLDPHSNSEGFVGFLRKSEDNTTTSVAGEANQIAADAEAAAKILGLRSPHEWRITTLANRPGLFILSNVLTEQAQLEWLERCLFTYPEPPNVTNLSNIGTYSGDHVFATCGADQLRWATMGNDYNWTSKEYAQEARQPLPEELSELCTLVVKLLGLGPFHPDAAIVNYYTKKASLSPHVDRSERDLTRPLVSLSFGQPAIYLTGGPTLDDPVDALVLHSGDILVMGQEQRLCFHAVPRILSGSASFGTHGRRKDVVLNYANQCRANITVRQVNAEQKINL